MSHFTVLVIGDDVDAQLAPFHEFECTGQDDEYVQDLDITEEMRKEFDLATNDGPELYAIVEDKAGQNQSLGRPRYE